ncbi:MAG TPA: hypothetical protein P5148_09990, partial [Anaerolineae bacterium]|nr:hypothetical protein [Anaerolineae bacterium]
MGVSRGEGGGVLVGAIVAVGSRVLVGGGVSSPGTSTGLPPLRIRALSCGNSKEMAATHRHRP